MTIKPAVAAACGVVLVSALGAQAPPDMVTADKWYNAVRGAGPRLQALLDENPASVNLVDRRGGVTPLMHAAALGSLDTMRLLHRQRRRRQCPQRRRRDGADVGGRGSCKGPAPGRTRRRREGGVRERPDRSAARGDERSVGRDRAPSAGARRRREGTRSRTDVDAGFAAAYGNDTEAVRLLLKAGAPVNQANVTGTTPLMNAATNGNVEAVKLLLAAGADVNAVVGAARGAGEERHDRSRPVHAADSGVGVRPGLARQDAARRRRERQREGIARHDAADVRRRRPITATSRLRGC